jgi:hypothetical protein
MITHDALTMTAAITTAKANVELADERLRQLAR